MNLASRSTRLAGQFLDAIIAFAPFLILVLLSASDEEPAPFIVTLWMIALLFGVAYVFLADALPDGQSFGKRILGIAVVDQHTGRPCSPWQSFVRNLLLAVLGILDWVFIFGGRRQRLGDMAAGTVVVRAAPFGVAFQQ
jgi:uncharacterized RDD family membrane protein YckC